MVYLTAPLPLPIGITIKPISRTRAASSQLRLAMRLSKIYVLPMMRYPVTVLQYTPTPLRCSLPFIPLGSVFDTRLSSTCATFPDYVTTLPMWERALLVHAMEKPIATPVGATKDATLLVISDEDAIDEYGSFGWVPPTAQEVL
jgi:hypothetical protein